MEDQVIYVPLLLMFALGAAAIAHDKGRAAYGWMLAGLCVGPLALAVILLPARASLPPSATSRNPYFPRPRGRELNPAAARGSNQGDRSWCTSSLL